MKKDYFSYLLRLWPAKSGETPVWRASLEDPHTGRQMVFASLERLFAFLVDQCILGEPPEGSPDNTSGISDAPDRRLK